MDVVAATSAIVARLRRRDRCGANAHDCRECFAARDARVRTRGALRARKVQVAAIGASPPLEPRSRLELERALGESTKSPQNDDFVVAHRDAIGSAGDHLGVYTSPREPSFVPLRG
jgi:hypothetical protein